MIARRSLLIGLGSLIAAPAIVRASSLMPIKAPTVSLFPWQGAAIEGLDDIRKAELIEMIVRPPMVQPVLAWILPTSVYSTLVAWTFAQASKSSRR